MKTNNTEIWSQVKQPPSYALKTITGGRLKGMTDIKPMWRLQALTEIFGPCGDGWKYTIDKYWLDNGPDGQVVVSAIISLYYRTEASWSAPIPGIGGAMLVAKESSGLRTSDEAYKMAVTDAISVAAKSLGFGADVYMGSWDGSKYAETVEPATKRPIQQEQIEKLKELIEAVGTTEEKFLGYVKAQSLESMTTAQFAVGANALREALARKTDK